MIDEKEIDKELKTAYDIMEADQDNVRIKQVAEVVAVTLEWIKGNGENPFTELKYNTKEADTL